MRGGGGSYNSKSVGNLVADAAGALYLAGTVRGDPPFTAALGNFTLVGNRAGNTVSGEYDGYVARLSSGGQWLWAVQGDAAGTNMLEVHDLAGDGHGHLYVGGEYAGTSAHISSTVLLNQGQRQPSTPPSPPSNYYWPNAFVAQLDVDTGAWGWAARAGGANGAEVDHITADLQGRVYVSGNFDKVLPVSSTEAKAAQLDGATGNWRWAGLGSTIIAGASGLTTDSFGRVYMATFFVGPSATFGPYTLNGPGAGYFTGVVARLGAGALATRTGVGARAGLWVWPNPSGGARQVQVGGAAPGALVQVLDGLGRLVQQARQPAAGPLALALPPGLAPGLYVLRSGSLAGQLVVE